MELRGLDLHGLELRAPQLRKEGRGRPSLFRQFVGRIERLEALDAAVRVAEPRAGRLVQNGRIRSLLHGDATGIPVHIILTDVPFGAWFMAVYLDLFSDAGTQRAATRLVGLGVISAAPTALTGWAEWALAGRATQRVGIVHAGLNAAAVLIFAGSWAARRRGRHTLGVRLARCGALLLIAGGFLGGYMASARRGS
ncbi:hypothetical protein FCN77_06505 [Arthrobacter sp. 24S4-2]|uniref:DUF2231 domain-containing protein n=1 Tax=Arthrobacter sp. 24S4-2 TaxID=2575374 RepID=UPI0010C7B06B|nr:DUF2231 domain-containing protein [Arthrobacter sp. 24S4-2]QCO97431.1 hypothetical protein FCN77_06505 [Arthrobacter sp. 24S4-2]